MQAQTTHANSGEATEPAAAAIEKTTVGNHVLDEEEVRLTAYFLWEQDGRPGGRDEHYWWAAVEKIARQKSSDALIQTSGHDA
jgi:hypothetical protein